MHLAPGEAHRERARERPPLPAHELPAHEEAHRARRGDAGASIPAEAQGELQGPDPRSDGAHQDLAVHAGIRGVTTGSVWIARGTSSTDARVGRPMCSYAISRASST